MLAEDIANSKAFAAVCKWRRKKLYLNKNKIELIKVILENYKFDAFISNTLYHWVSEQPNKSARDKIFSTLADNHIVKTNDEVEFEKYGRYLQLLDESFEVNKMVLSLSPLEYIITRRGQEIIPNGLWLEFGVWRGTTINLMAAHAPAGTVVYGFDSFEGLPTDWKEGFEKGTFDRKGVLPEVKDNVSLVPGWFDKTLPPFLAGLEQGTKISVLHIDCDVYISAACVLNQVAPFLQCGTFIIFDELLNYAGFEKHEILAWFELIDRENIAFEWVGMKAAGCLDVGLRITKIG